MKILLVDNGSLEPAAILATRALARDLSVRLEQKIFPLSLLHSDKVASDQLDGIAADVIEPFLRRAAGQGEMDFKLLPLFIGPSRAISDFIPELLVKLRREFPGLHGSVAPTLYQADDSRLGKIMAENVRAKLTAEFFQLEPVRVALVDHGSPVAAVTAVRDALALQLKTELGDMVTEVAACSMERRLEREYDFNDPLLGKLLAREGWEVGPVVVAQLFLAPGRHAGPEGDIGKICRQAKAGSPALRLVRTEVLGAHPKLIDILVDRYRGLDPGNP